MHLRTYIKTKLWQAKARQIKRGLEKAANPCLAPTKRLHINMHLLAYAKPNYGKPR